MKKLLLFFGFLIVAAVFFPHGSFSKVFAEENIKLKIISNTAIIYENADSNSLQTDLLYFSDIVETSAPYETQESGGYKFVKIFYNKNQTVTQGYILETNCRLLGKNEIKVKVITNASVKCENNQLINLFLLNGNNYVQSKNVTLSNGERVRILSGYNKNEPYTLVQFEKDTQVYNLFIQTEYLSIDGFANWVIILLSILLALCTIGVYTIIYTKRKR